MKHEITDGNWTLFRFDSSGGNSLDLVHRFNYGQGVFHSDSAACTAAWSFNGPLSSLDTSTRFFSGQTIGKSTEVGNAVVRVQSAGSSGGTRTEGILVNPINPDNAWLMVGHDGGSSDVESSLVVNASGNRPEAIDSGEYRCITSPSQFTTGAFDYTPSTISGKDLAVKLVAQKEIMLHVEATGLTGTLVASSTTHAMPSLSLSGADSWFCSTLQDDWTIQIPFVESEGLGWSMTISAWDAVPDEMECPTSWEHLS